MSHCIIGIYFIIFIFMIILRILFIILLLPTKFMIIFYENLIPKIYIERWLHLVFYRQYKQRKLMDDKLIFAPVKQHDVSFTKHVYTTYLRGPFSMSVNFLAFF